MALHTVGSTTTTALRGATFNPPNVLAAADLAAIANAISGDGHFAASKPDGILITGSTHASTTLDTLAFVAGGPLAAIAIGSLVLGAGIPPGTFVTAIPSGTSVTLSQAATTTAAGVTVGIISPRPRSALSFNGQLEIPGRGILQVKNGDVVAIDNTGWPILLSAATIRYPGSLWSLV